MKMLYKLLNVIPRKDYVKLRDKHVNLTKKYIEHTSELQEKNKILSKLFTNKKSRQKRGIKVVYQHKLYEINTRDKTIRPKDKIRFDKNMNKICESLNRFSKSENIEGILFKEKARVYRLMNGWKFTDYPNRCNFNYCYNGIIVNAKYGR